MIEQDEIPGGYRLAIKSWTVQAEDVKNYLFLG